MTSAGGARAFRVRVDVPYAGDILAEEAREAIWAALRADAPAHLAELPDSRPTNAFSVTATVHAAKSIAAVTALDSAVDRALMRSGMFEEFDSTGRTFFVEPMR